MPEASSLAAISLEHFHAEHPPLEHLPFDDASLDDPPLEDPPLSSIGGSSIAVTGGSSFEGYVEHCPAKMYYSDPAKHSNSVDVVHQAAGNQSFETDFAIL